MSYSVLCAVGSVAFDAQGTQKALTREWKTPPATPENQMLSFASRLFYPHFTALTIKGVCSYIY